MLMMTNYAKTTGESKKRTCDPRPPPVGVPPGSGRGRLPRRVPPLVPEATSPDGCHP